MNRYVISQAKLLDPKSASLHPTNGIPSFWPTKSQLSAKTHRGFVFTRRPNGLLKQHMDYSHQLSRKKGLYLASTAKSKITHKSLRASRGSFQHCLNLHLAKAVVYTHIGKCFYRSQWRTFQTKLPVLSRLHLEETIKSNFKLYFHST